MSALTSFISKLLGASKRLSSLEKKILNTVRNQLDAETCVKWDAQIEAINKVQRLPEGVEVNFYRMRSGKPYRDQAIAFDNKTEELNLAKVELRHANVKSKLIAHVWCVKGFLFTIEYKGSVSYFEEAAGLEEADELQLFCTMLASLKAT